MRILILDDDTEQRRFLRDSLTQNRHQVEVLDDPQEALTRVEDSPLDVIIAEYDLGDFAGVDLVNGILSSDLERYPFIIFVTDEEQQSEAVNCLGPIPGDYLVKPVRPQSLQARLSIADRSITLQNNLLDEAGDTESLALYDRLTGVLNRQAVYEQALAEVSRAQRVGLPLSLAMLEINNLDQIRHDYGSEPRNQMVQYVARALRANVRIYDLVGRWIGSKFLLMLPGATIEEASRVADRVDQSIATIHVPLNQNGQLKPDVTIAITTMPRDEILPLYMLIEQANETLQWAREEEGPRVILYEKARR